MELSQQETSTSTSTSTSAAAQYPPEEPPFKSPDRVATTDDAEEIFSPTSAAALALSTLCGAATASFSRVSVSGGDASRQRPTSLSRTRLFNSQKKQNENSGNHNSNNYTSIRPSSSRQPVANVEPSISQQQQQPPYNPSPSASPRYYPSTKHPAAVGNFYPPPGPGGRQIPPRAAYQARAGYPHGAPYHSTENHRSRGPSPTMPMHEGRYAMEMNHPRNSPRTGGPHPFHEHNNTKQDKPLSRLASHATTLVTPTPKKQKIAAATSARLPTPSASLKEYSRKKKSLGILAENFLNSYQNMPPGSTIVVDEAAVRLGVERRRIYDVVNILEAICLVSKKHKNTYSWLGKDTLDGVFGRLQAQAIREYPQDAQRFELQAHKCDDDDDDENKDHVKAVPLKPPRKQKSDLVTRENKSLAKLSQEFLQVFLVGHVTLSLPEASDKIQGTTSVEELIAMGGQAQGGGESQDAKELKAAAARGLKTKIRRLYDIANVFLSVGLLEKVDSGDSSRRPNFSWSYRLSAKEIHQLHTGSSKKNVKGKTPTTATNTTTAALVTQPEEQ